MWVRVPLVRPFFKEKDYKYYFTLDDLIEIISNNLIELNLNFTRYYYENFYLKSYKYKIDFLADFYKYYANPKYLFR